MNRLQEDNQSFSQAAADKFFLAVTQRPKTILVVFAIFVIACASQIPKITKDASVDAFIRSDHPTLVYRDKVKELFGLQEAIILAVVAEGETGIFNPQSLALVKWMTDEIQKIPYFDPNRVSSIATERNIYGSEDQLFVEDFLSPMPKTQKEASAIKNAIFDIPLYKGFLVSEDGTSAMIVAELADKQQANAAYDAISILIKNHPSGGDVYVAGEGAASGYLSRYIDSDARKLQPIAFLIMVIMMYIAFRKFVVVGFTVMIIGGTAISTMGIMGASGVPYYAITNALTVILIGISIADSIHILSQYYSERAADPAADQRTLVLRAMGIIWRPVFLTTLTTMGGFLGIALTSTMPPMMWFGTFAMLGCFFALVFSYFALPAALVLTKPHSSPAFKPGQSESESSLVAQSLSSVGQLCVNNAGVTLSVAAVTIAISAVFALDLKADRRLIENFSPSESIYQADRIINQKFSGSSFLDIVIETPDYEGLFDATRLKRMEALETYAKSLPNVQKTVSIVDYLKLMNRSLDGNKPESFALPQDENLIAQYFLLYSASADPTDFEDEIDQEYRQALIRIVLNTGQYSETKPVVEALQNYVADNFTTPDLTANLSGRVTVDHYWMEPLARSHFTSVAFSLFFVFSVSAALFRSLFAGLLTVLPVASAVLVVYAYMGLLGIWLEPATSMFAAIAIGLGVDFAIHTVDRMKYYCRELGMSFDVAVVRFYETTGRALFVNWACLFFGFEVLLISELPTLFRFGLLTMTALAGGFLLALTVLPPLIKVTEPLTSFSNASLNTRGAISTLLLVGIIVGLSAGFSNRSLANTDLPSGLEIATKLAERDEGSQLDQRLTMQLINRNGKVRKREAKVLRRDFDGERRSLIYFEGPTNIKGTSFLTYDYDRDEAQDNQWIFLPALSRVRMISASDRGDNFLGTDFTYEDVKEFTSYSLTDYNFRTLGQDVFRGKPVFRIECTPNTEKTKKEIGYSRIEAIIDPETWMPMKAEYWDIAGNPMKSIDIAQYKKIDDIWTPTKIIAKSHKSGHTTVFDYADITFDVDLPDDLFSKQQMEKGF